MYIKTIRKHRTMKQPRFCLHAAVLIETVHGWDWAGWGQHPLCNAVITEVSLNGILLFRMGNWQYMRPGAFL